MKWSILLGLGVVWMLLFWHGCTTPSEERKGPIGAGVSGGPVEKTDAGVRGDGATTPAEGSADGDVASIGLSFKLDRRLTQGVYLGDLWVSPPTFTIVQPGTSAIISARAKALDSQGGAVSAVPYWNVLDPEMVTISPPQGGEVAIAIGRPGQSRIEVEAEGVSSRLLVRASNQDGAIRVDITRE